MPLTAAVSDRCSICWYRIQVAHVGAIADSRARTRELGDIGSCCSSSQPTEKYQSDTVSMKHLVLRSGMRERCSTFREGGMSFANPSGCGLHEGRAPRGSRKIDCLSDADSRCRNMSRTVASSAVSRHAPRLRWNLSRFAPPITTKSTPDDPSGSTIRNLLYKRVSRNHLSAEISMLRLRDD
jgi:hypothetical protein